MHLRKFINITLFSLLALIMISCGQKRITVNLDKEIYKPYYSSNFLIEGNDSSLNSLITVFNPWQGASDISTQLLISDEGETAVNFDAQIVKGDVERIICMSSTHIAMLDALGAIDRIVGVSGIQYISNSYIQENKEKIPDIGYEGNINYEALIAAKPDLVLLFSVNGVSTMESRLKELGIPFIYIGDYVEEDPLGKAEWIVPIAEIIGKREEGIRKFYEIRDNYNNLKNKIATANLSRPKVMVNAPFMDAWFMPSTKSYVAKMIEDAGGDYIYKKNTGNSSLPIDMEEALNLISQSDYWINTGSFKTLEEVKSSFPLFKDAKCINIGNLYNNNLKSTPGGGNDCYESGVVNPHLILKDMIKIFHPELISDDFTYYHQLK